ncbi:MAG: hypothetical protein AAGH87_10720 [Pseudomonadota bacterium]
MTQRLVAAASVALFVTSGYASADEADFGPYPNDYEAIVKNHFEMSAVDPQSIRYRAISEPQPVNWDNYYEGGGYQVCVTFNARNRMGGYAGWSTRALIIRDGEVKDWLGVTRAIVGGTRGCPEAQILD